jgi:hypothetical protein
MIATTNSDHLLLDVFLKDNNGERLPLYSKPTSGTTPGEAYNCKAEWYFRTDSGVTDVSEDSVSLCTVNGEEANTLLVTGLDVAKGHYGIVKVSADFAMPIGVVEGDSGDTQKKREVSLDCLQAIPWAAGNYYISGPTQIVYNNYGTLDNTSMFDSPYRLFFERD